MAIESQSQTRAVLPTQQLRGTVTAPTGDRSAFLQQAFMDLTSREARASNYEIVAVETSAISQPQFNADGITPSVYSQMLALAGQVSGIRLEFDGRETEDHRGSRATMKLH